MRPVDRGSRPSDSDGKPVTFRNYQEAKPYLEGRLGEYCSYCERRQEASLAVEHIQPKSLHPELVLEWENFLLACSVCNSVKGDKDVILEDYLWPHKDNTSRAFLYRESGIIEISPDLSESRQRFARNTLKLVGLQKQFRSRNHLKRRDKRWIKREKAWRKASEASEILGKVDTREVRRLILQNALSEGYWSIWMEVFKNDAGMCRELIEAFSGTCHKCFDEEGKPVPRQDKSVEE